MFSWEVSYRQCGAFELKRILASTQKSVVQGVLRNGIASKRMRALNHCNLLLTVWHF